MIMQEAFLSASRSADYECRNNQKNTPNTPYLEFKILYFWPFLLINRRLKIDPFSNQYEYPILNS